MAKTFKMRKKIKYIKYKYEFSYIAGQNANWYSHFGTQFGNF